MDWPLAIEKNRAALAGIVATLFAYAGLDDGAAPAALPRLLRNALLRLLRPAESAVRRLIVIAALGVSLRPSPLVGEGGCARPKDGSRRMRGIAGSTHPSSGPSGHLLPGGEKKGAAPAFPLSDPRKRFAWAKPKTVPGFGPRISTPGVVEPVFLSVAAPSPDDLIPAARLARRLCALKAALDDLPRQALRLARRQARMVRPTFSARGRIWPEGPDEGASNGGGAFPRSPLRPGRPPGHRHRGRDLVDEVLAECHGLAVLAADTS